MEVVTPVKIGVQLFVTIWNSRIPAFAVMIDMSAGAPACEIVQAILQSLEKNGMIPRAAGEEPVYSEAEEEKIRKRLEDLGYV